jgi:hypothetical protein
MARQKAIGKSEEGLGDFTFLYTVWFYCVHLLILKKAKSWTFLSYKEQVQSLSSHLYLTLS